MGLKLKNKVLQNEVMNINTPFNVIKGTCSGFSIDMDDDSFSSFLYKTEEDRDSDFMLVTAFLETFNLKFEYVG